MVGVSHRAEVYNSLSRADSILFFPGVIYVIEVKYASNSSLLGNTAAEALLQIKNRNYALPYLRQGKAIRLLGLAFTKGDLAYAEEIAG
jgi:hypothetical protein